MSLTLRLTTAALATLMLGACTSTPGTAPGTAGASGAAASAPGAGDPITLPVADDPTISFMVWFKAGSQNDPPGKEGLAALTASMLSDGATTENSYEQILEELYPLAAGYSARVDKEMTTLSGRTHRDTLDAFFRLFSDAYLRPAFDAADFERLKSDQRNYVEKTLRYATDEDLGKAALESFVYAGTRYAHPIAGTLAGLDAITLEDVERFYRRYYTAANAEVALGGGYPHELAERFAATLEQLPAADAPPAAVAVEPPAIEGREVLLVDKPGADASISFGFPIDVVRGEDDFYALWLANSWLGEHRNSSSHLYQVIREARGLNYGDYSYIEAFPQGGQRQMPPTNVARGEQMFQIWIRTLPNENAVFALRAALRELERMIEEGMSQQELELTRAFLETYVLHFAPTTRDRLGYAIDDRFYGIDGGGHLERFRERIRGLTLDEVNTAIRRHLQTENMKIAIVTGDVEGITRGLTSGAPTPIDYPSEKPPEVVAEDLEIASYPLRLEREVVEVIPVDEIFSR